MNKNFGGRAQLLFIDTVSLANVIETADFYEDMSQHMEFYDTSDYPPDHSLYSEENKKEIGIIKDEFNGKTIHEFVGLRPKMYRILLEEGKKKTAKGVSRSMVQKRITHADYKTYLMTRESAGEIQVRIQSSLHQLITVRQNKVTLSAYDDKRYLFDDGINSVAYGHFCLRSDEET